jgi:hypothetical protein
VRNVPPEGTILRCVHGLYWPHKETETFNPACSLCTPMANPENGRANFKMPRPLALLNHNDKVHANKKQADCCPKCGLNRYRKCTVAITTQGNSPIEFDVYRDGRRIAASYSFTPGEDEAFLLEHCKKLFDEDFSYMHNTSRAKM